MTADPVAAYHALLTDAVAAESQAVLVEQLARRGLFFGDRPLCTVLRPRFFEPAAYRELQARCAVLLRAFRKAHRAALADDRVLDQFGLMPWERELVRVDPGFTHPSPTSRLDTFLVDGGGMRLTEYNAETPAGAAYNDVLTQVFYALPVMRAFMREWDVRPLPARPHVLHALLDAWEQWSGESARSLRIAIVDWPEVPTTSEFHLFQRYFEEHGHRCDILAPDRFTYDGRTLLAGGETVDVVYKRVLLHELVERGGTDHPLLRAFRAGDLCMVNAPGCKILHKKASLAVLSDDRNVAIFDDEERAAIDEAIPWTRVVEDRRTWCDGREVDLLPFLHEAREQLVLKPNDEYGGKGIVLGWEVDDNTWRDAIAAAQREPFIAQWRIPLPSEPYPSMDGDRVVFADRLVDTAPYVAYGEHVEGCLTRLGTTSLLNVTAGGGSQTPTFTAERR